MPDPLLDNLPAIRDRLTGVNAPHLLVLLDYESTVAPVVAETEDAPIDLGIQKILELLAQRPDTTVALLSGCAQTDLRKRVGIERLIYSGSHGLEIKGPGMAFEYDLGVGGKRKLANLATELTMRLARISGIWVDFKGVILQVDFRGVSRDRRELVDHIVRTAVETIAPELHLTSEKDVFDIRPRVEWSKGKASLWIRDRRCPPNALVIYLGADQADDEAFQVLNDAITIKVGVKAETTARYYLPAPIDVCTFLNWLAVIPRPAPQRS